MPNTTNGRRNGPSGSLTSERRGILAFRTRVFLDYSPLLVQPPRHDDRLGSLWRPRWPMGDRVQQTKGYRR
jgi:hypothetical protein